MTTDARIMRIWCRAHQRIVMAVTAGGCCYNDAGVARIAWMLSFPSTRMTGRTIAARGKGPRIGV